MIGSTPTFYDPEAYQDGRRYYQPQPFHHQSLYPQTSTSHQKHPHLQDVYHPHPQATHASHQRDIHLQHQYSQTSLCVYSEVSSNAPTQGLTPTVPSGDHLHSNLVDGGNTLTTNTSRHALLGQHKISHQGSSPPYLSPELRHIFSQPYSNFQRQSSTSIKTPATLCCRLQSDSRSSWSYHGIESHSTEEICCPNELFETTMTQSRVGMAMKQSNLSIAKVINSEPSSLEPLKTISSFDITPRVIKCTRTKNYQTACSTKDQIEVNGNDSEDLTVGNPLNSGELAGGGSGSGSIGGKSSSRSPGACTYCKRLKMKCAFAEGENTCRRCKPGGRICVVEGRRLNRTPIRCKSLLVQIKQRDALIETLLKQFNHLYMSTPALIASSQMAKLPPGHHKANIMEWFNVMQSRTRRPVSGKGEQAFQRFCGPETKVDDPGIEINFTPKFESIVAPSGNDLVSCEDNTLQKSLSLPDSSPFGLIANLSLNNTEFKLKEYIQNPAPVEEDDDVGVANAAYFMPGPTTEFNAYATSAERHYCLPEILAQEIVTSEDVDDLFKIFFNHVNPFVFILDPHLHTPASTLEKCPFLFTVICAVSSRFYTKKPEIYPIAMHFARHSAANALNHGRKSVELCQAYILMSLYSVPGRRWEENTSWLHSGMAITIATDLNLHQVSTSDTQSEKHKREMLNRNRTWLTCSNVERWTAMQLGKPSSISKTCSLYDSEDWYKKDKYNHPYDIHLCAYSGLVRMMDKFHDEITSETSSPGGLNKMLNLHSVILQHDAQIAIYQEEWLRRFSVDSGSDDVIFSLRCILFQALVAYSRLALFSCGFQRASRHGVGWNSHLYFDKCIDAAKSAIRITVEGLATTTYMRYAPDVLFMAPSSASAFLLKLLQPEFSASSHITVQQEIEILNLVRRLVETLSSPEIAVNDRHTPKLYARFLASLLSRHSRGEVTVGCLHPHSNDSSFDGLVHIPSTSTFSTTSLQSAFGGSQIKTSTDTKGMGSADNEIRWDDMYNVEMFAHSAVGSYSAEEEYYDA